MTRLEKLKQLEENIKAVMAVAEDRSYASLAKQYRETIKEIEEIEGAELNGDEIAEILNSRDGQPGTVRTNRA